MVNHLPFASRDSISACLVPVSFLAIICWTGLVFPQSKDSRVDFVERNGNAIQLIGDAGGSDLKLLDQALKNKKIVLLGEFTHGSREINQLKIRLIDHLHRRLGFKVLLLESGVGEIYSVNFARDSLSDRQMLAGLTGPWQTEEYLELMNYLKQQPALQVGGFDVQRSGRSFSTVLETLLRARRNEASSATAVEQRFGALSANLQDRKVPLDADLTREKEKLAADYRELARVIEQNERLLARAGWTAIKLKIVGRTIENRLAFLDYQLQFKSDGDLRKRFAARDRIMAENVLWFAREAYPGQKIIVSAHNFHIAKHSEKETAMGETIAATYGTASYAIGIFGGQGELADNARKPETLTPPATMNDIQVVINDQAPEAVFLPLPRTRKRGAEWLFEDISVNHSFVDLDSENRLVLQKSFDGLVLIKKISPPRFVTN